MNDLDKKAESVALSEEELKLRQEAMAEYWKIYNFQESVFYQKSRSRWLKDGDSNSKYFHSIVNWKRRKNSIVGLVLDGSWVDDPGIIKSKVKEFFEDKFSSSNWDRPKLDGIQFKSILETDNAFLCAEFSVQEIKDAVWQCGNDKSPGPDGYNFRFIKSFWSLLKDDVQRVVSEFFLHGAWPRGCNASFIALIPKVDPPLSLNDFRPI